MAVFEADGMILVMKFDKGLLEGLFSLFVDANQVVEYLE